MSNGLDLFTPHWGDGAIAVVALALHALALILVAGAVAAARPALWGRGRRRAFLLAVQPFAMLLAGLFQYWASAQAAAFHWRHPLSSHNLLVFWGVPYFLHVLVRVADLARPETPRAAGAEADYSDDGPARPAVAAAGLDVTPPRVRRT